MNRREKSRRLLLLVESRSARSAYVLNWLQHKGFVTWWATDVAHAMEELSDFTVQKRPDVVMTEASPLSECLHTLRADLCGPESQGDVSVVAMCDRGGQASAERFYATDLAQLETIIDREAGPRPLQV